MGVADVVDKKNQKMFVANIIPGISKAIRRGYKEVVQSVFKIGPHGRRVPGLFAYD